MFFICTFIYHPDHRDLGFVSLMFCKLSKIISRKYTITKSHLRWEFQAQTLCVCPKHETLVKQHPGLSESIVKMTWAPIHKRANLLAVTAPCEASLVSNMAQGCNLSPTRVNHYMTIVSLHIDQNCTLRKAALWFINFKDICWITYRNDIRPIRQH